MTKEVKPKFYETFALFKPMEQKDSGKHKKKPFTRFILDMPHIDNEIFSEICVNEGYKLNIKVEYLPYTTSKEKSQS